MAISTSYILIPSSDSPINLSLGGLKLHIWCFYYNQELDALLIIWPRLFHIIKEIVLFLAEIDSRYSLVLL